MLLTSSEKLLESGCAITELPSSHISTKLPVDQSPLAHIDNSTPVPDSDADESTLNGESAAKYVEVKSASTFEYWIPELVLSHDDKDVLESEEWLNNGIVHSALEAVSRNLRLTEPTMCEESLQTSSENGEDHERFKLSLDTGFKHRHSI